MKRLFVLGCIVFASGALAQSAPPPKLEPIPAPPPPSGAALDEPNVRIPVQEGDVVEEIKVNGRVVQLKVTPKNGPVYYLVDPAGNGVWVRRNSVDDGVRVPMWPVYTFD